MNKVLYYYYYLLKIKKEKELSLILNPSTDGLFVFHNTFVVK